MDAWQKLDIASKVFAAILVPLAVAYVGNQVAVANKQRDSETKFVEIAAAILSKDPTANKTPESTKLRAWALEIINKYSGVPMLPDTQTAVIEKEPFPKLGTRPPEAAEQDPAGTWGVVLGATPRLSEARQISTENVSRMGLGQADVFRRAGVFRIVKVVVSHPEAEDALGRARNVQPSAYLVDMTKWCPSSDPKGDYFECREVVTIGSERR